MDKESPIKKREHNISVIVPCFNEEDNVYELIKRIVKLSLIKEIILIDDGSKDKTVYNIINAQKYHANKESQTKISLIELTRNFGKEAAVLAGLDYIKDYFDAVIILDADLQHPPEIIPNMIEVWKNGAEVVTAIRDDRESDSFFKETSAYIFYEVFNKLAYSIKLKRDVGDFRLLTRPVIDTLRGMREYYRFSKGLIPWTGFNSIEVSYHHDYRYKGDSSWNSIQLLKYAIDGIFSFSYIPLRVWSFLGVTTSIASILYASLIIIRTILLGVDVPGYASLIVTILFLGGIQLIGIGVLGDYIGRIYVNSKSRPHYIIRRIESNKI